MPWMQSLIVLIFNSGDKSIPSNDMTIMISYILSKLYELILEKNISHWLESHDKRAKGKARFGRHHSNLYHLIPIMIITEECHDN